MDFKFASLGQAILVGTVAAGAVYHFSASYVSGSAPSLIEDAAVVAAMALVPTALPSQNPLLSAPLASAAAAYGLSGNTKHAMVAAGVAAVPYYLMQRNMAPDRVPRTADDGASFFRNR